MFFKTIFRYTLSVDIDIITAINMVGATITPNLLPVCNENSTPAASTIGQVQQPVEKIKNGEIKNAE